MKITDDSVEINQSPLPSRSEVQETLNVRARNPEMEEGLPRTRTPFGHGKLRLGVTKLPGYHMHWIADYPGRLEEAEDNGYEYVTKAEVKLSRSSDSASERISRITGAHETGRPLTLWLMKIKDEWYRENQEFYLERVRKVERQIKSGHIDGRMNPETYIPRGAPNRIATKLE